MSPSHHDTIIDIVVNELNVLVEKYSRLTNFKGKISLLCHSLGSVIAWDILSRSSSSLRASSESLIPPTHKPKHPNSTQSEIYPDLHFDVSNFFMIGSPVAVFLMLRSQPQIDKHYSLPACPRVSFGHNLRTKEFF